MYEERAIKFIKNRERLLKRLQKVIARIPRGETDPDSGVRRELCTVMLDLRACSVLLIESVSNWQRACGPKPRDFFWENQDYLQKLMLDTEFVESYAYVAETLCVQGPFFLSFAPLHEKSEIKHAMLVRAGTCVEDRQTNSQKTDREPERVTNIRATVKYCVCTRVRCTDKSKSGLHTAQGLQSFMKDLTVDNCFRSRRCATREACQLSYPARCTARCWWFVLMLFNSSFSGQFLVFI